MGFDVLKGITIDPAMNRIQTDSRSKLAERELPFQKRLRYPAFRLFNANQPVDAAGETHVREDD